MEKVRYSDLDVFVLTYNRAKNLREMLVSLANQTAEGFHITVLNNASTDNTVSVVQEMIELYPERDIELVTHKKNLGNVGNFKKSQEIARNKYTAVFHDDDLIHPEYIETAMTLFTHHPEVVLCSGNVAAYYNPGNYNWDILSRDYYYYPKGEAAYLSLLLNRQTFQNAIYLTSTYKSISYCPEKYGKLHDIIFLMDISKYGPSIHILGQCARVGISLSQDSCQLKTGPFPEEIAMIVERISQLVKDAGGRFRYKHQLWNFTYFLYIWGYLSRFETWYRFVDRLRDKVFNNIEIFIFSRKKLIDILNKNSNKYSQKLSPRFFRYYPGPRVEVKTDEESGNQLQ